MVILSPCTPYLDQADPYSYSQSSLMLLACPDSVQPIGFFRLRAQKVIENSKGPISKLFTIIEVPIRPTTPAIIGSWVESVKRLRAYMRPPVAVGLPFYH